jgi:hypothetical protein
MKPSRVLPELVNISVYVQDGSIRMLCADPSLRKYVGAGSHPENVKLAEAAELAMVILIGCVTNVTAKVYANTIVCVVVTVGHAVLVDQRLEPSVIELLGEQVARLSSQYPVAEVVRLGVYEEPN